MPRASDNHRRWKGHKTSHSFQFLPGLYHLLAVQWGQVALGFLGSVSSSGKWGTINSEGGAHEIKQVQGENSKG